METNHDNNKQFLQTQQSIVTLGGVGASIFQAKEKKDQSN